LRAVDSRAHRWVFRVLMVQSSLPGSERWAAACITIGWRGPGHAPHAAFMHQADGPNGALQEGRMCSGL
jgi:hypothetical protein